MPDWSILKKSLYEELGGTCTLGKDGMYYPNLMIEEADQPMVWAGRMNSIRSRAEEIVMEEVINTL